MDYSAVGKNEDVEIDIQRLLFAIIHRSWLIILVSVVCAVIAFLGTYFFVTPEYQASAMFYVNNSSLSVGDASLSISSGDLSTSRNLVESYIVILKTRESLSEVIDYAGVDRSYNEVRSMISASAVNETEIFQVVVTSTNKEEAKRIADAIAYILPKRISSIIEGTSAKVADCAVMPASPSSPSYTNNTMVGFLFGLILMVLIVCLREIFDVTIRSEDDITQISRHPVLAAVPDMTASTKGGYDYSYDRKKQKSGNTNHGKQPALIGSDISFAAAESYKLLRTKLQFSFADDNHCRVIGLSSAISGEGKSLTAVNLAYTLALLDKKVILIDCDMRRPTLAEKLLIQKKPGLSSYLTGQSSLDSLIQKCGLKNEENAFEVIAAGQNPPNPIELLSSNRMANALNHLRERYDYIILDLPPVGEVSDAMAVAKSTDGMLLVVRQNYCDRIILNDAVRQFEFVDAKILGMVFNFTTENGGRYGKNYYRRYYKKYYRRYYGRYNKKYEGSYLTANKRAESKKTEQNNENVC